MRLILILLATLAMIANGYSQVKSVDVNDYRAPNGSSRGFDSARFGITVHHALDISSSIKLRIIPEGGGSSTTYFVFTLLPGGGVSYETRYQLTSEARTYQGVAKHSSGSPSYPIQTIGWVVNRHTVIVPSDSPNQGETITTMFDIYIGMDPPSTETISFPYAFSNRTLNTQAARLLVDGQVVEEMEILPGEDAGGFYDMMGFPGQGGTYFYFVMNFLEMKPRF